MVATKTPPRRFDDCRGGYVATNPSQKKPLDPSEAQTGTAEPKPPHRSAV